MKRTLLAILLCSQSLWADPLSTSFQRLDWPGAHPSVSQRAQVLDQAESTFRQKHDAAGLVRVECLRLEPLLYAYDPSCPERMRKLEKAVAGLAAGPARAQYYWVWSIYAGLRQDTKTRDEFQKLAFAEPGVEAVEKARWLLRIAKELAMTKSKHQWLEAQRRQLGSAPSSPQLRYLILGLHRQAARDSGDQELAHSNALSRIELATREHWPREELENYLFLRTWCPNVGEGAEAYWKQAWAVAQREKSDELRLLVLSAARNPELYKQGISQLDKPLSEDDKRRHFLAARLSMAQSIGAWTQEISYCQRAGELDKEIQARLDLARALESQKRVGEAIQQFQAAYDLSQQLATGRNGWVADPIRPFAAAESLSGILQRNHHAHRASALQESMLKASGSLSPSDECRIRRSRLFEFRELGDEQARSREWTAILALVDSLPAYVRTEILSTLLRDIPRSREFKRAELVKRTKESAESDLRDSHHWIGRSSSARVLADCLKEQGDAAGRRLLLQQLLESAPSESERSEIALTLLADYRDAGLVSEYKLLLERFLKTEDLDNRTSFALAGAQFLAQHKDPQALVLAEELVRLSSRPRAFSKNIALGVQAEVLYRFGRYQAGLDSLDAMDPREGHASQRARFLGALNRKPEACAVLKQEIAIQLKSEAPQNSTWIYPQLVKLQQELGEDWPIELERAAQRFQSMGEPGEVALSEVVYVWLDQLVSLKQWDKGRELLTKYPWKLGASHYKTKKLREYEQWKDLLPAEEKAVSEPGQVGAASKDAQNVRELVDQLRLNQPQLGELLSLRSTNLKYLQERLGPKETLVTYCSDGDQFYTIALRNRTSFFKRSQVSSRDLESLREKYLKALNSDKPSDSEASLFSTLLEPVLTEDSSQRILVVPTGTLWQLPFGALRDSKARTAASRSDIVLLTSGDLLRLADNSWSPYRLSKPLAIGAPPAADLPGAFRELGEVAGALPNCELRRGDQATMASLYDSSRQWGLVHFASHAHYHQDRPLESDIQLHDGGLKIRQLSQLSLAEHALVTLSVCQGGDSAGQRLSEPVSLATGFSASGAETVVANLWPVEDEVARVFFGEFYKQLGQGDSPMKSFRQAQDKVRAKFPKPEDWAGFFLMGNPT